VSDNSHKRAHMPLWRVILRIDVFLPIGPGRRRHPCLDSISRMASQDLPRRRSMAFLDRENIVAKPGHSRWLIPPAALCVHLCIGQAYAFSVFNLPLTKVLGVSESLPADW